MEKDYSFGKELAKASLVSLAVSAASTAGFFGGLALFGIVVQKISDKKKH